VLPSIPVRFLACSHTSLSPKIASVKIFLYEYTCNAGVPSDPDGLPIHQEGWSMLSALQADFSGVPHVETIVLLDDRCKKTLPGAVRWTQDRDLERTVFGHLARIADYTVVIAPEFSEILLERCRWVEAAGACLLGSSLAALRLAGDKLELGKQLRDHGLPTPECCLWDKAPRRAELSFPLVLKPRHGAGSQATFRVDHDAMLQSCLEEGRAKGCRGEFLLQSFVVGTPVSVALLVGPQGSVPLLPAYQHLSKDGRFHYLGGSLPLPPALAARARKLAQSAVSCVPGLKGYVGVDLVLGNSENEDWIIEINPRLTTSYVGLRALARANLAAAMLQVALGGEKPNLVWKFGRVQFTPDGRVTFDAVR
jgi:predicted ATP-grasp superfamily ATP-dependent carboligase